MVQKHANTQKQLTLATNNASVTPDELLHEPGRHTAAIR